MDTQLEERLKRDLFDVTREVEAPVGFAHDALRSGRRLRRRRTSVLVAGGVAAVVAGVLLVPHLGSGDGPGIASEPVTAREHVAALRWARTLPQGDAPALPMFTDKGLRDGDIVVPLPPRVDTSRVAQRVEGGWVVMLHSDEASVAPAVLSPDGSLRPLAPYPDRAGGGYSTVFVSPDGLRVAYGDRVVDVLDDDLLAIPHDPAVVEEPDGTFVTSLRIYGWTDEGLVYEGAPTVEGLGTEWLLRDDGSTVELGGPDREIRSYANGTAGFALTYDYSEKQNTCVTSHTLRDAMWVRDSTGCMGRELGESLDLSPDGRRLLTDDLPEVWDVAKGTWVALDAPADVLAETADVWMSVAGWESDDTLLLPLADNAEPNLENGPETVEQTVQVVRCYISTRSCERAGPELEVAVASDMTAAGPTPLISFSDY